MAGLTFKTNSQVSNLPVTGKRYEAYRASSERGKGRLGVEVSSTGTKRWFYRYIVGGKRKFIRLGLVTEDYTMTIVQKECDKFAEQLGKGVDPKEAIAEEIKEKERISKVEAKKGSVRQLFEAYTKQMEIDGKRTFKAVLSALEKEVLPFWREETKAKDIVATDVVTILSNMIQRGAIVQSNRVRSYLVAAFNFGLKHDLNPAQQHTGIKFGLTLNPAQFVPKQSEAEKVGENWLAIHEVHQLLNNFGDVPKIGRSLFALLKLCFFTGGQRPYELVASKWSSINWEERTLLITSDVSKNKREHFVPLTNSALLVLEELKGSNLDSPYIFPKATNKHEHLRTDSFGKAISRYRAMFPDFNPFVARDIRRTCKTLMGELGISKELRDRIQNHAFVDVSTKHYDRYDYLFEKRLALEKWEFRLLNRKAEICQIQGRKNG